LNRGGKYCPEKVFFGASRPDCGLKRQKFLFFYKLAGKEIVFDE